MYALLLVSAGLTPSSDPEEKARSEGDIGPYPSETIMNYMKSVYTGSVMCLSSGVHEQNRCIAIKRRTLVATQADRRHPIHRSAPPSLIPCLKRTPIAVIAATRLEREADISGLGVH